MANNKLDKLIIEFEANLDELKKVKKNLKDTAETGEKEFKQFGDKGSRSVKRVGDSADKLKKKFKDLDKSIGRTVTNIAKIGGVLAGAVAVGGVGLLTKALFDAGVEAEKAETRISAIFNVTREQSRKAFQALERFASPLPVKTQEIVDSFVQLSAINFDVTERTLKGLTKVSLAFNREVDNVANAIASLELEPLKRLGVQWDRTGEKAVVSFKGATREVRNTDQAIRETLLELFNTQLPNAIETAKDTYSASMAVISSVTQRYLTQGGIVLKNTLKGIAQQTIEWIEKNDKLIQQNVTLFAKDLATSLALGVDIVKALVSGFGSLEGAMRPVRTVTIALTEAMISAGDGAVALNKALIVVQETALSIGQAVDKSPRGTFGLLDPLIRGVRQLTGANTKEGVEETKRQIQELKDAQAEQIEFLNKADQALAEAKQAYKENADEVKNAKFTTDTFNEVLKELKENLKNSVKQQQESTKLTKEQKKALEELAKQQENFKKGIEGKIESYKREIVELTSSEKALREYDKAQLLAKASTLELGEETKGLVERMFELREQVEILESFGDKIQEPLKKIKDVKQAVDDAFEAGVNIAGLQIPNFKKLIEGVGVSLEDAKDKAEQELTAMQEFAIDTAGEIRNAFAEAINNLISGEISDLGDVWDNVLSAMRQTFSQFIAEVATKPIILNIQEKGSVSGGFGESISEGFSGLGDVASGIGGLFGLDDLGGGIGDFFGGIGSSISGAFSGLFGSGAISSISSIVSGLSSAIPLIGTAVSLIGGLVPMIGSLFEDRPRFDVEVFNLGNEGEIQADLADGITRTVSDIIRLGFDEAFRKEQIFVKGKGGAEDIAEAEAIRKQVAESLNKTVDKVFNIINKLPTDLAGALRQTFRDTELVFEQLVDDVSLEFDEGSSKIEDVTKRWKQFLNADLPARFLTTIESFFEVTLQGLGVTADNARQFVESRLNEIKNTESRELRGKLGQEFLQEFEAFVTAFNIVQGNFGDKVSQAINKTRSLAEQIGFDTVPSLDQLTTSLEQLIQNAELDADTVNKYKQLREQILSIPVQLANRIGSLTSQLNQVGGNNVSFLQGAVDQLQSFLEANRDNLSLTERENIASELSSLGQQLNSALLEQQRQANQGRIDSLETQIQRQEELKQLELESIDAEIKGKQQALEIARQYQTLNEQIENDLNALVTGSNSPLTDTERLNRIRAQVSGLEGELSRATTPEQRLDIIDELRSLQQDLISVGSTAFGVGSPQFNAIFTEVKSNLNELLDVTDERGRSTEEIQASIESLNQERNEIQKRFDSRVERLNGQIDNLRGIDRNVAQGVQGTFSFLRNEFTSLLEARMQQLTEATAIGDNQLVNIESQQLGVLQEISNKLSGNVTTSVRPSGVDEAITRPVHNNPFIGFEDGGIINEPSVGFGLKSGQGFTIAEKEPERVTPLSDLENSGSVTININVNGNMTREGEKELVQVIEREIRNGGLRSAVRDVRDTSIRRK